MIFIQEQARFSSYEEVVNLLVATKITKITLSNISIESR